MKPGDRNYSLLFAEMVHNSSHLWRAFGDALGVVALAVQTTAPTAEQLITDYMKIEILVPTHRAPDGRWVYERHYPTHEEAEVATARAARWLREHYG